MDNEHVLVGLELDRIALMRGGTSFSFGGKLDGEFVRYECATAFEVCFDENRIFKDDIVDHPSTINLWNCLERKLVGLHISDDGRICSLKLDGGPTIYISSRDEEHDNLLVVRRWQSDEWFTIG